MGEDDLEFAQLSGVVYLWILILSFFHRIDSHRMKPLVFLALFSLLAFGQDEQLRTNWAHLRKYAADNKTLGDPLPGHQRVVFMGNSIGILDCSLPKKS